MVKAVTYILENNVTVQGLVGLRNESTTDYKIFPVVVFQDEKAPYVVVTLVSKTRPGKNCDYNGIIQVASYANSYDDVTELNDAVKTALLNQAAATLNGVAFGFLNFTNEQDGFDKEHVLYVKILTVEGVSDQ